MTHHREKIVRRAFFALAMVATSLIAFAGSPSWEVFDPDYPQDYVDTLSIKSQGGSVVRFWERAGTGREERQGKVTFPSYTLTEMNCSKRAFRDLKWDYALEFLQTPEGMLARSNFLKSTQQLQKNYPSDWESIEPNKHATRALILCAPRIEQRANAASRYRWSVQCFSVMMQIGLPEAFNSTALMIFVP